MNMLKAGASVLAFQCFFALPGALFISIFSHQNFGYVGGWLAVTQLVSTQGLIQS